MASVVFLCSFVLPLLLLRYTSHLLCLCFKPLISPFSLIVSLGVLKYAYHVSVILVQYAYISLTFFSSAAYLLAVLGGNSTPDEAAVNKILGAVGVEADKEKLNKLIAELKGKVCLSTTPRSSNTIVHNRH